MFRWLHRFYSRKRHIEALLVELLFNQERTMASIDDVVAAVANLTTKVGNIEQALKSALGSTTLPPDVQAKVDAIFAEVNADAQSIDDALKPSA